MLVFARVFVYRWKIFDIFTTIEICNKSEASETLNNKIS